MAEKKPAKRGRPRTRIPKTAVDQHGRGLGSLRLFTVDEVATATGTTPLTIRAYLRAGKLHGKKVAGKWLLTEDAIRAYFTDEGPTPGPAGNGGQA